MFRRKLLVALAAVMATLALAVPVLSASAATTAPAVHRAAGVTPASPQLCALLSQQKLLFGTNSTVGRLLASVMTYMHC
jgi:hypothetical protein